MVTGHGVGRGKNTRHGVERRCVVEETEGERERERDDEGESCKMSYFRFLSPFYFFYHPSTCLSDAKHTCALLNPLQDFVANLK